MSLDPGCEGVEHKENAKKLAVGDLFSGIGGFSKGLEDAGGFETKWFVEIDPYCQRVLAKHWPNVQRYGDIRAIDWATVPRVDLLCGGFPCQDLSFAGKRAGIDGERSGLWSEYVRAIRALRPRYILVENVPGLLTNQYMGRVLGDLAQSGYDAEWDCLPAGAFGAQHWRDRVWILAYTAPIAATSLENLQTKRLPREFRRVPRGAWSCGMDQPPVVRRIHGVPVELDRYQGLGNAIVPQIAEWLGRQIMSSEQA